VNSTARTLIVACLTFASALVGFLLQRLLPVQYLTDAKGMVGSITGLVILFLALVYSGLHFNRIVIARSP
jgi:putative effector of murein hydrolase LrgA (UPF0299 family)